MNGIFRHKRIRINRFQVFLIAAVLLGFFFCLTSCNRDFNNSLDPKGSEFIGDSLTVDLDGNGVADLIDEYAPECRGEKCIDSALVHYKAGTGRHPRIQRLTSDSLVSILDTVHIHIEAVGLYPITRFFWGRASDGLWTDSAISGELRIVPKDSGLKTIRIKAMSQGPSGRFLSRDTALKVSVLLDAPHAILTGPDTIRVGQPVQFQGKGIQQFGSIVKYKWDNGTSQGWSDSSGSIYSIIYSKRSKYQVKLYVEDDDGNIDTTVHAIVALNEDPKLSAIKDTVVNARDTVKFNLSASDPDGIRAVKWDFDGDGIFEDSTSDGMNAHLFSGPSRWVQMSVEAIDPFDGKTKMTAKIQVDATPPDAPNVWTDKPITNNYRPTWSWSQRASIVDGTFGNASFRYKLDDSDLSLGAVQTTLQSFRPIGDLSEGSHTLYVQEKDAVGNWSAIGRASLTYDITPPNRPVIKGSDTTSNNKYPTWSWVSGDKGGSGIFRWKVDDSLFFSGAMQDTLTSFTQTSALTDGQHTFYVQEQDLAGNWSTTSKATLTIDATAPAPPSLTAATQSTHDTMPIWTWKSQGGGNGTFRYKLEAWDYDLDHGGILTTQTSFRPGTGMSEGLHTLFVQERDSIGNWSAISEARTYVDITPPLPPIVSTSPLSPTNITRPSWIWNSGGGGNGFFRYKLDDSTSMEMIDSVSKTSFTPASDLSPGNHILYLQECDNAGNWSKLSSRTIYVDGHRILAPYLSVTPISPTGNTRPTWTWVSTGGTGLFRYQLDDSIFTIETKTSTKALFTPGWDLEEGGHTLYVQEKDGSGNWSFTGSQAILIQKVLPSFHTGFIGTSFGIMKTLDGGATWTFKLDPSVFIRAIYFLDANTGWAISSNSDRYWKSIDGGSTWTGLNTTPPLLSIPLFFANSNIGWVAGPNGTIYVTQNGGNNWKLQPTGTTQILNSIYFVDGNVGWAVGDRGTILNTQNAGSNWQGQSSGTTATLNSVQFIDANTGWCAGDLGIILKTSNGGTSWTNLATGTSSSIKSLFFIDANTGWAAGQNATILKTTDGGITWGQVSSKTKYNLNSIYFYDANFGWAAGDSGTVVKTIDGGTTWTPQPTGTFYSIQSVVFPKSNGSNVPSAPKVKVPSDTNSALPIWTWTTGGGGNGVYRYKLDNPDFANDSKQTYSSSFSPPIDLPEGAHTLYVQESNGANTWSTSGSGTVNVDRVAPAKPLFNPLSKWTNSFSPTWNWSSGGGGNGTFRYKLDDSVLTLSSYSTTLLSYTPSFLLREEGPHILFLQERDYAGNWSDISSGMVIVDVTPPPQPTVQGPSSPTNRRRPSWSWSPVVGGDGTYRFKVDTNSFNSGDPISTSTTFTPSKDLSQSTHTFYLQARDSAGNWSSTASSTVQVIWTQPSIPIITSTPTPTTNRRPSWSWSSGGGGIGIFRFLLDDSTFSSSVPGTQNNFQPSGDLSEGKHTLYVEEQDSLGYWSNPGKSTVTVDLTPPAPPVVITSPPSPTNLPRPAWVWTPGGGGNGLYRFKLDDPDLSAATPVTALYFVPSLDLGNSFHTLYVEEQDSAGNWSTAATASILVDATRINPPTVFASPGSPTGNPRPTWSWNGSPRGTANYRYKLNDTDLTVGATVSILKTFTPTSDLPEGEHTLYVQQQDSSGIWSFSGSKMVKVEFILPDAHVGFVSGYTRILKTTNGGSNWSSKDSTYSNYGFQFLDSNLGFTTHGGVYKTNDGGVTWEERLSLPCCGDIGKKFSFANQNMGWLVWTGGLIYKTINGGIDWSPQSSGTILNLNSVFFVDANSGWTVGVSGTILKTSNGGANWFSQPSGTTAALYGVMFTDVLTGWAVGSNIILKTSNGGVTWNREQLSAGGNSLFSLDFINASTGWTVGSQGTILKTVDGGATWTTQISGTSKALYSVEFLDSNTGWAVGSEGTILKTNNGGTNWVQQISGTTQNLWNISFP